MWRRDFVGGAAAVALRAQPAAPVPPQEWCKIPLIPAPDDPSHWRAYRLTLARWRQEAKKQAGYDDSLYGRPDFAWVTSSFACCFLMMCDEMFYNHREARYEVEAWVDRGIREFGGYDSVLLWHAYPRIGLDERNQFDFYRDMPGGLPGVRKMAESFQSRGVKVYIDYNPWDTGTRREPVSDIEAVVAAVQAIGADGIFLDTMNQGSAGFRASLDSVRKGVVLESEGALPLDKVSGHHMSWAQGFKDSSAPGVLRNKWFERRHMQHQIRRWNHDHTGELHAAWMNGSGMIVWENVFGSWVGWCARDRSILRSMLPIQRRYAALFSGEGWTPLVSTVQPDVYASRWERGPVRLWTLVNRSEEPREGTLLSVSSSPGARYFDLILGREVPSPARGASAELQGAIRPRGIACFLAAPDAEFDAGFGRFLAAQSALNARADFDTTFPSASVSPRPAAPVSIESVPADMVAIGPASYNMIVEYRIRETGFYTGQEYTVSRGYNPEAGTRMFQLERVSRQVSLAPYALDLTPVTNAQYAEFLRKSGYRPRHPENFLKHWSTGAPPPGQEDHPVVYVDLDDSRAYAAWAGKRLPSEEEWQYAAQGPDARRYPWGNAIRPGVCNAGQDGGTTPVKAFPEGRSPFGCYDMCGNTWEWTETERSDGRTRFAIIRGGSWFEAFGSFWYMDGGPQPANFAAKFLLMWPGLDRCSTIGFRCAAGLQ
jgi:formylglycine-generating enzyme required for sulfatase activity